MKNVLVLLEMFGERYIYCTNEQALFDCEPENREELVKRYSAIIELIHMMNE